jgi:methylenetetrahydrofolate reductase (NADPH)
MHIRDHFARATGPTLSFEFFPPKTEEARTKLHATIDELASANPAFISLTYGAGGSTRDATQALVKHVKENTALDPVPHFTCVNHRENDIDSVLQHYAGLGIDNILALRSDAPRDRPDHDHGLDFCRHASDLVRYIQRFNASGVHPGRRGFAVGAACFPEGHPATPNRLVEMEHLKEKVDVGVDFLVTQAFFDNHVFHDFRARCDLAGIRVPILAGILPLPSRATMFKMAELAGGMRYPAALLRALDRSGDDAEAFRHIAVQHAVAQCADLLDRGVDGLHFYTLNQADPVLKTLAGLGSKAPGGDAGNVRAPGFVGTIHPAGEKVEI